MRTFVTFWLLTAVAFSAQIPPIDLLADKLTHEGTVIHGQGHARAKLPGGISVQADDATLHPDTGDFELRGHVHVAMPAREDHVLFRYAGDSLVTDQAVVLTAERMTLKSGRLEASGSVVAILSDPEFPGAQLRADELSMDLKVADATLRGHVRAVNMTEHDSHPLTNRPRTFFFPPDIIK